MNVNIYWKKIALSAVAAAVLLVGAVAAWSQQPRAPRPPDGFQGGPPPPDGFQRRGPGAPFGPGDRRGPGPFGPFGRDLNLTDDQKSQIQKIQQSFQQGDQ